MTKQKQLLYRIVRESDRHMTAEEIYTEAHREMPSLALGTVYRNLGKLTEEGLIGRLAMPMDAPARYDREPRSHPHLVCERCGSVKDIFTADEYLRPMLDSLHVQYTGFDMNVYHICGDCAAAQKQSNFIK